MPQQDSIIEWIPLSVPVTHGAEKMSVDIALPIHIEPYGHDGQGLTGAEFVTSRRFTVTKDGINLSVGDQSVDVMTNLVEIYVMRVPWPLNSELIVDSVATGLLMSINMTMNDSSQKPRPAQ